KPGRELMLHFLDRHAVAVVDAFAFGIIAPPPRTAGKLAIVPGAVDRRTCATERRRLQRVGELGHRFARRRRALVALSHHDPAYVFEHPRAVCLAPAGRTHVDDAGLAVRIFPEPDDFRDSAERVARI